MQLLIGVEQHGVAVFRERNELRLLILRLYVPSMELGAGLVLTLSQFPYPLFAFHLNKPNEINRVRQRQKSNLSNLSVDIQTYNSCICNSNTRLFVPKIIGVVFFPFFSLAALIYRFRLHCTAAAFVLETQSHTKDSKPMRNGTKRMRIKKTNTK